MQPLQQSCLVMTPAEAWHCGTWSSMLLLPQTGFWHMGQMFPFPRPQWKRHRRAEWIRKHDLHICCLQETHLRTKDLYKLKVKGWEKVFQENGHDKKAGVAILISDKIDFKTKAMPWLVRLSGLSTGLQTKWLPVRFLVMAHAWVAGQVPSGVGCVCERQSHTDVSLPLFLLPFSSV